MAGWITPFKKQCFVTLGVVMNMAGFGMVVGYTTSLLKQLRLPESYITIDDSVAGWIAAIVGLSMLPSSFLAPVIMGRYGRRIASILSLIPTITGWFLIITATNFTTILIARCLQGLTLGMISTIGPILIGEYTSPKNRGMFLTTISLAICVGTVTAHTLGLFLTWQKTALIFAILVFINLIIVLHSPESPSWLISKGRFEESKEVFKWLRGDDEEDELKEMIAASVFLEKSKEVEHSDGKDSKAKYWKKTVKKKEFYKPLIIVLNLYTLAYWGGGVTIAAYVIDVVESITGKDSNLAFIIISVSIQRIFTQILTLYIVKRVKRRTLLTYGGLMNVVILVLIGIYVHFKSRSMLPFDHVSIGIILLHLHVFSFSISTITLPYTIAGEVFPLEYRSISSAVSVISIIPNMILVLKSFPFLINSIGLNGTYFVYASVISLNLLIVLSLLPETKDRTLQDIENEFRGFSRKDRNASASLIEKE